MRGKLWSLFLEYKFKSYYYIRFRAHASKWDKAISGMGLFTSAASIAGWSIWNQYSKAWGIIIGISQLAQVFKPLYPFTKQLAALDKAVPEMNDMIDSFERDWNHYGKKDGFDDEKGEELYTKYQKAFRAIDKRYASEQMTPTRFWISKKAEEDYHTYFKRFHNATEWSDAYVHETNDEEDTN